MLLALFYNNYLGNVLQTKYTNTVQYRLIKHRLSEYSTISGLIIRGSNYRFFIVSS